MLLASGNYYSNNSNDFSNICCFSKACCAFFTLPIYEQRLIFPENSCMAAKPATCKIAPQKENNRTFIDGSALVFFRDWNVLSSSSPGLPFSHFFPMLFAWLPWPHAQCTHSNKNQGHSTHEQLLFSIAIWSQFSYYCILFSASS